MRTVFSLLLLPLATAGYADERRFFTIAGFVKSPAIKKFMTLVVIIETHYEEFLDFLKDVWNINIFDWTP